MRADGSRAARARRRIRRSKRAGGRDRSSRRQHHARARRVALRAHRILERAPGQHLGAPIFRRQGGALEIERVDPTRRDRGSAGMVRVDRAGAGGRSPHSHRGRDGRGHEGRGHPSRATGCHRRARAGACSRRVGRRDFTAGSRRASRRLRQADERARDDRRPRVLFRLHAGDARPAGRQPCVAGVGPVALARRLARGLRGPDRRHVVRRACASSSTPRAIRRRTTCGRSRS